MKFPVKIRDILKIEKSNFLALMFLVMKIKKNVQSAYQKLLGKRHVDLLLIGEEGKRHNVLIKDFNTFMHDHTLHRGRKHFSWCCLQAFITEEILRRHIKDCFKINDKQRVIIPEKGEFVKSKNYERKIKSLFIIYADLESILVPQNNGK